MNPQLHAPIRALLCALDTDDLQQIVDASILTRLHTPSATGKAPATSKTFRTSILSEFSALGIASAKKLKNEAENIVISLSVKPTPTAAPSPLLTDTENPFLKPKPDAPPEAFA